ncbi:DUF1885 family protein [Fictibacillus sp. Mic-4]|uniref:DUF1885 family protein n=1 Tax=Fictibacillus TaxID=1329200 RepID=UPI00041B1957|nr:DUF1885 family protein [Fictibacillus gelatini]
MANNAYIKLVPASAKQSITLQEVKDLLLYYKDITSKTGDQLAWKYEEASFPYTIEEKREANSRWFYLKGTDPRQYKYIMIGIDEEASEENSEEQTMYIQVTVPDGATHGDKGKANEFCKFLAKKLSAELHLFNGRIMYYYKRK